MKLKTRFVRQLLRRRGHINYLGLNVPLPTGLIPDQVLDALYKGQYERPELIAATALLRSGDQILELGAGIGIVSGLLAKRFSSTDFISYEANPALVPVISALHECNGIGNVALRSAIVAPTNHGLTRRFRLHRHFTESSLTATSADEGFVDVPVHDPVTVMNEVQPDILLCDIEGGEEELIPLLPMNGLRAAIIELHPHLVSREGMGRVFRAFLDAGLVPVVELSTATVMAFERVEVSQS